MKLGLVGFLILVSCIPKQLVDSKKNEMPPNLELIFLKPTKPEAQINLGSFNAYLYNQNGSLIQEISAPFGDCLECTRGVSVKGHLGLRIEGNSPESFIVLQKKSTTVEIKNCSEKLIDNKYSCNFSIRNMPFSLKLSFQVKP